MRTYRSHSFTYIPPHEKRIIQPVRMCPQRPQGQRGHEMKRYRVSRQVRWQIKMSLQGKCVSCGRECGLSPYRNRCLNCGRKRTQANRRLQGTRPWKPGGPGRPPLEYITPKQGNLMFPPPNVLRFELTNGVAGKDKKPVVFYESEGMLRRFSPVRLSRTGLRVESRERWPRLKEGFPQLPFYSVTSLFNVSQALT